MKCWSVVSYPLFPPSSTPLLRQQFYLTNEPDVSDLHLFVDAFAHIVDRQERDADGGERVPLHSSLRDGARGAGHFRRVLRHDNVDLDLAQWNGVTQWNKMHRLLGCLNSSDARGRDDIALGDFISTDKIDGFFAQSNFSRC